MRYERDNSLSVASAEVSRRIRESDVFLAARALVLSRAIRRVTVCSRGELPTYALLRELGGWTAIVEDEIKALPDHYRVDAGSKLFPKTVASELIFERGALREELQSHFAKLHQVKQ